MNGRTSWVNMKVKKWISSTYLCNDSDTSEVIPLLAWIAADHISFISAFADAVKFLRFFAFFNFWIKFWDSFLFRQAFAHLVCYFALDDLWNLLELVLDCYTTWICFFIWFLRCTCLSLILCRSQGCASLRDSSGFFSSAGSYSWLLMSFASC